MKIDLSSLRPFLEKLNYAFLMCTVMSIPFSTKFNNLFAILFFITWLFQWRFNLKNKLLYFFSLFYFVHLIGVAYSVNSDQAFFDLEKKVGFLMFPLAFTSVNVSGKKFNYILLSFACACTLASLICLSNALYHYLIKGATEYFFYYPLTEIIGIHPIYFSMYLCFSIFIVVYFLFSNCEKRKGYRLFLYTLVIGYLILFIFLLSARAEIISFYLITFIGIVIYSYRKKKILMASGIIGVMLIILAILIYFIPANLIRFKEAINYKNEYSIDKQWGGRALRLLKWDCSIEVIKKNPAFGVGTGDTQDVLQECYKEKNYFQLLHWPDVKYNAHNQYLQTLITFGFMGFVCLMLCLLFPFYLAFKESDYLYMAFISLFLICCLTESMLEVHKGIVFFALFVSLFASQSDRLPSNL